MLTTGKLIDAGYKEFPPNSVIDKFDALFQKRIRDVNGTRYFIDVTRFDFQDRIGWEMQIQFGKGFAFAPQCAVNVLAFSVAGWEPAMLEKFAQELWWRLSPNYYEREA